eukprot:TRINITY_DN8034_c0_g1_i1.p1 TRINITY_DN8034_c0_g1~~TRINITY_DN8034_c0_g1_i1.p1  ORF type:complete len:758 (+),score=264.24 TRINITY_DN8034_c0_g1_i1:75-2276(+)
MLRALPVWSPALRCWLPGAPAPQQRVAPGRGACRGAQRRAVWLGGGAEGAPPAEPPAAAPAAAAAPAVRKKRRVSQLRRPRRRAADDEDRLPPGFLPEGLPDVDPSLRGGRSAGPPDADAAQPAAEAAEDAEDDGPEGDPDAEEERAEGEPVLPHETQGAEDGPLDSTDPPGVSGELVDDDQELADTRHTATFLPNAFTGSQREALARVFAAAGISSGEWSDFLLLNHLSTREWTLQTDQYSYLGRVAASTALTEALLHYTHRHRLPWVRHCPPVTFEIDAASLWPEAPHMGGSHGFPQHFDPATEGRPPEEGRELSYLHMEQLCAALLNKVYLKLLARDCGLHALQDADQLPTLGALSPAEQRNPTLLLRPAQLIRAAPDPARTNLEPSSRASSPLPGKLLGLLGAVHMERGGSAARAVARQIWGISTTSSDLAERAVEALDRQVIETTPAEVADALLQQQGLRAEWSIHSVEVPLEAAEHPEQHKRAAYGRALGDGAAAAAEDDAAADVEAFRERSGSLSAAAKALGDFRSAERAARAAPDGEAAEGPQDQLAATSQPDAVAAEKEDAPGEVDEYTLHFDALGKPIDIRQTSAVYPVEPGPHQSDYPLAEAPMYAPPRPDAPIVERMYWKRAMREGRERSKRQLEGLFSALLTPRELYFKAVLSDQRTGAVLGSGAGRSCAAARLDAQTDYLRRVRANLSGLCRAVRDVGPPQQPAGAEHAAARPAAAAGA